MWLVVRGRMPKIIELEGRKDDLIKIHVHVCIFSLCVLFFARFIHSHI